MMLFDLLSLILFELFIALCEFKFKGHCDIPVFVLLVLDLFKI